MSLKLAAGIVCAGSLPAAAERTIVVELAEPAPFDATQLATAMRMRLPADGAPVRLRISRTSDGVHVETTPGSRDVALHGLAGTDAARLVALAATDLLLDDLAAAPALEVRGAASASHDQPIELAVAGSVAGWDGMLGAGSVDLSMPWRGLVAGIEVGGGALASGGIDLRAGLVRLDAGRRVGMFELRAGLTLAPIFVSTGTSDATILAGGNASVRLHVPLTRGSHAVLAIGADAFATRTRYDLDGMTVMATPRVAPWFAAGVGVAL